jgi:hypothetical protein
MPILASVSPAATAPVPLAIAICDTVIVVVGVKKAINA